MAKEAEALFDIEPLPGFSRADDAIRLALPALAPLARVKVSETAERRMIQSSGQWVKFRGDFAPYMTEPMDVTTSRRFDSIAFVGPARSSKSEGLVINPLVHAILAQPRVVAVFSPKKDAAKEWSEGMLDPLILNSPELRARLATGKGADNIFTKRFRGGTRITIDWPVAQKLAQRSIALVIGTDYDAFDADIDNGATAFNLMRKRTENVGSRGMTIVESSPRKPILDETWTPKTAHEAPPCEGIVAIYNAGSRGRLYWPCRDCGAQFEPRFDRLRYPDEGSPAERAAAAHMACPDCGSVIEARQKPEFNQAAFWLHEEENGDLVPLNDLKRATATASFWLPGPAAVLAPWSRIVSRYLEAEEEFARTGGEGALVGVVNVELGLPYQPRARTSSAGLSETGLREAATEHAWQIAPDGTAFLTAAVDVQPGRFVVQVEAWLPGLERVVIDRFDIFAPAEDAPAAEGRRINPARYAEDWDVLFALADREYPVAGQPVTLRPLAIVVDANGEPGVTPNAYAFYRRARIKAPRRFYVLKGYVPKGSSTWNAKRAVLRHPETAHRGKAHVARDVPIIFAGVDRLKDEVAASLLRDEAGERKLNVPRYAPAEVFAEYAAERRGDDGWKKRPGVNRNEALDLSVYNLALAIVLEAEAINWDRPPAWAQPGPGNLLAREAEPQSPEPGVKDEPAPQPEQPRRWAVRKPKRKW